MRTIALLVTLMLSKSIAALPATPLAEKFAGDSLQLVGSGEFKFLGFHLYDASYWRSADGVQALKIDYRKAIRGEAFNRQMITEWRRLRPATAEQRDKWAQMTGSIWPDVRPGSSLTAIVTPDAHTEFLDGDGRLLGRIDDAGFGPAFLAIWLDPRTRARQLRSALMGNG